MTPTELQEIRPETCPKCGAECFLKSTLPQFECGTQIGDIHTGNTETLYQSDKCRIRELEAEVARQSERIAELESKLAGERERIINVIKDRAARHAHEARKIYRGPVKADHDQIAVACQACILAIQAMPAIV